MARRGGKANTRKSRQKRAGQRPSPAAPQRAQTPSTAEPSAAAEPVAPQRDAFEVADDEVRAAASAAQNANRPARPKPGVPRVGSSIGPSRLTANAAAEYHYVVRDLRNIGVLLVVMAVLLVIATVVVNLLGIGQP